MAFTRWRGGAALTAVLVAVHAQAETGCERLAVPLGMTASSGPAVGASDRDRLYKVSLVGLGTQLFGGTVSASFKVEPVDDTPGERTRLAGTCQQTKAGVRCDMIGPARLTVGTRKGVVASDFHAGEHAVVELRKSSLYCHDL